MRREVFCALGSASRDTVTLDGGFLKLDLREPRRELASSLRGLRRARQLVSSDPGIMGGKPVFRNARVPVHLIAALAGQGASEADLVEAYPRLTAEMVHFAPIYAAAYPLRGRPRTQSWANRQPTHSSRRKLTAIEGA